MVKELREISGAGMMDAKKALVETKGDMEGDRRDAGGNHRKTYGKQNETGRGRSREGHRKGNRGKQ